MPILKHHVAACFVQYSFEFVGQTRHIGKAGKRSSLEGVFIDIMVVEGEDGEQVVWSGIMMAVGCFIYVVRMVEVENVEGLGPKRGGG
jgi:hypothetical protein